MPVDRLSRLPREILEYIAFLLCAQDPLGPPSSLVPLLLTSSSIHSALSLGSPSKTQLYAKLCRLKFDCDAVERRCGWRPGREELEGHLVQMCNLLSWLRKASTPLGEGTYGVDLETEFEVEVQLIAAYVAMLDDDGRNRAQLRHAGIEVVVERYVRKRLYEGVEDNDNWPLPSITNSCAMWVWWMFTTRESLLRETKEEKEEIIRHVFPYMANPYRYAAALAPPTHYALPIGPSNPTQKYLYSIQTAQGTYPLYPTLSSPAVPQSHPLARGSRWSNSATNGPLVLYYFNTSPQFVPPLIAPVASLLYWSRRELRGFFQNPGLLRTRADIPVNERGLREGLTQEDLQEFNRHQSAKMRGDVEWDWDLGTAVRRMSPSVEGGELVEVVKEGHEPSREWDLDWARGRLCIDVIGKEQKWRVGSVYKRGILNGTWAGVQFDSHQPGITALINQAERGPEFTEEHTFFGARPIVVELKEHGFVRTPSTTTSPSLSSSSSTRRPPASSSSNPTPGSSSSSSASTSGTKHSTNDNDNDQVPAAPPVRTPMTITTLTGDQEESDVDLDASLNNAWFPGPLGSVRWYEDEEPLDDGVLRDAYAQASDAAAVASGEGEAMKGRMGRTVFVVDGEDGGLGGLGGPVGLNEAGEAVRRGARASVYERYEEGREGVHERLVRAREEGKILNTHQNSGSAVEGGVARHPGCEKCAEREGELGARMERMRERARKRRGEGRGRSKKREVGREVEEVFASVGLGKGEGLRFAQRGVSAEEEHGEEQEDVVDVEFDEDEEEDYEEDESMDEDEEDGEGELDLVPISPSTSVPPSRSVSVEPHDDSDDSASTARPLSRGSSVSHEGTHLDPSRSPYSPFKLEPCDHGVRDTLLTGGLSPSSQLAWGKSVWYGRVRPWDGLVGALRVGYDRDGDPIVWMVYYGYVYGGDTWVGRWRYAMREGDGSVDPLMPKFESAFVMSRRG